MLPALNENIIFKMVAEKPTGFNPSALMII